MLNKGFSTTKKVWKSAKGRGYFKQDSNTALLKVTFFWPFYGDYKVIRLDRDYSYAVVTSGTNNYLWILARKPELDAETLKLLVDYAAGVGFDVSKLEYIEHTKLNSER